MLTNQEIFVTIYFVTNNLPIIIDYVKKQQKCFSSQVENRLGSFFAHIKRHAFAKRRACRIIISFLFVLRIQLPLHCNGA